MSETSTTTLPVITPDVAALLTAKDETIRLLTERVEKFSQQIEWLQRQLFGRKSEKIDPSQPFFDALMIQAIETNPPAAAAPKVESTVVAHTRGVLGSYLNI